MYTPGGNISRLVANFPNFYFAEVDGTDPEASYRAFVGAVEYCRAGKGPAFVHGHCVRVYSHSFSDDDKNYRLNEEREADAMRDPLHKLQMRLLREGILSPGELNALEQQIDEEIAAAAVRAVAAAIPSVSGIMKHVYSEDFDPTRAQLATQPRGMKEAARSGDKNGPWPT